MVRWPACSPRVSPRGAVSCLAYVITSLPVLAAAAQFTFTWTGQRQ